MLVSDISTVNKEAKETRPLSPALEVDKVASSLPVRGTVLNRVAMYENLSKMCADNQATYNSIPQLRSRKPFSMKVGGQAVPSTLLQRTKKTAMARTVYTSNPAHRALATEPKAANLMPQQTKALAPSPSKDARVTGSTKSADQTGIAYAFDVPSPQSSAPESMQYDSGVASDTNSPAGAPSSPSVHKHALSSPTGDLTEVVEHMKTPPSYNTKKREQSHVTKKSVSGGTTTPTLQMPGLLSATAQLVGTDLPPEKEETCKKLSLNIDNMEVAQQDRPLQTIPPDTVPSSTTALPSNGAVASKPGVDKGGDRTPPTHEAVASSGYIPANIDTTVRPSGLRERKPSSHVATSEETSSIHAHPADSSSTGEQSQRSFLPASLKSQGAQIALNVAISVSVVSLPYPYHTVMMGLLILGVCVFFFIMTLPYHAFGKNFLANE